jgi:4-hydroxy-tetrahydrodipicolinate reductase
MKVALIGYGKMGKEIEKVLSENSHDEVVVKISEENLEDFTVDNLKKAEVAIEFTQPAAAVQNILKCFEAEIPVVVGTTGWLQQLEEVTQICKKKNGALFHSPNFSIGVNIFFELNRVLASLMERQTQYAIGITEIHHTEKKDAPSGTAIKTAELILSELKRIKSWQLTTTETFSKETIPVVAKREPGVPGTHSVVYKSAVDELVITHQAYSRRGFAEGAVAAARWLMGKKGVFEMKDMLAL